MEHRLGKNVIAVCSLKEGDIVTTDLNYKLEGKPLRVESIRYYPYCQTRFMVKVIEHEREVDSDWFDKI